MYLCTPNSYSLNQTENDVSTEQRCKEHDLGGEKEPEADLAVIDRQGLMVNQLNVTMPMTGRVMIIVEIVVVVFGHHLSIKRQGES